MVKHKKDVKETNKTSEVLSPIEIQKVDDISKKISENKKSKKTSKKPKKEVESAKKCDIYILNKTVVDDNGKVFKKGLFISKDRAEKLGLENCECFK